MANKGDIVLYNTTDENGPFQAIALVTRVHAGDVLDLAIFHPTETIEGLGRIGIARGTLNGQWEPKTYGN